MKNILPNLGKFTLLILGILSAVSGASAQTCHMDATIRPSDVTIPARINPAKEYTVKVIVENSGTCTWESSSKLRLSVRIVKGPSGSPVQRDELTPIVDLKYKVEPGKSNTFQYEIEGPYYLGQYTLEWVMAINNKAFGSEVRKTIEVVPPK